MLNLNIKLYKVSNHSITKGKIYVIELIDIYVFAFILEVFCFIHIGIFSQFDFVAKRTNVLL